MYASRCDHGLHPRELAHGNTCGRRDSPFPKSDAKAAGFGIVLALGFDGDPGSPAGARHVHVMDIRHKAVVELLQPEIPQPVSFATTNAPSSRVTRSRVARPPLKECLLVEYDFHRGVQMHTQCVRAHSFNHLAKLRAVLSRLHHTNIAQDQNIGSNIANLVGADNAGIDKHSALAPRPESIAAKLRDFGELPVDITRLRRAAGHRRNHERKPKLATQQLHGGVDIVEAQVGQSFVYELDLLEQGGGVVEADVAVSRRAPRWSSFLLPIVCDP